MVVWCYLGPCVLPLSVPFSSKSLLILYYSVEPFYFCVKLSIYVPMAACGVPSANKTPPHYAELRKRRSELEMMPFTIISSTGCFSTLWDYRKRHHAQRKRRCFLSTARVDFLPERQPSQRERVVS